MKLNAKLTNKRVEFYIWLGLLIFMVTFMSVTYVLALSRQHDNFVKLQAHAIKSTDALIADRGPDSPINPAVIEAKACIQRAKNSQEIVRCLDRELDEMDRIGFGKP